MIFRFSVGSKEKHNVVFYRNHFTGDIHMSVDDKVVYKDFEIIDFHLKNYYEFDVGDKEKHYVKIVRTRPILFSYLRKQKYDLYIDDNIIIHCEGK
jgi:hypothetical protein